jgi:TPR repeat protein
MRYRLLVVSCVILLGGLEVWADTSANAQYALVKQSIDKHEGKKAIQMFVDFKTQFPTDDRIPALCRTLVAPNSQDGLHSAELVNIKRLCPNSSYSSSFFLWERGAALFNKKDYQSAQKYFQRIIVSYPTDDLYPVTAFFYNAECYFQLERWDDAAGAFKSFYVHYPKESNVPLAMGREVVSAARAMHCAAANEALDRNHSILIDNPPAIETALAACHDVAKWADVDSGKAAFTRGDYAAAEKELRPIATTGNPEAELYMGLLYERKPHEQDGSGRGLITLKKNNWIAEEYFLRSAKQGNSTAQAMLAHLYLTTSQLPGNVPAMYVQAYYWISVAVLKGYRDGETLKQEIRSHLTEDQSLRMEHDALAWRPSTPPKNERPRGRRCEYVNKPLG